jgi:hypothetical protein
VTRKTWRVLWGILAVLVIYVLAVERPFRDDVRGSSKKKLLFENFDPAKASAIEIESEGRNTRLEKDGGTWVVASNGRFPADAKAVGDLLARVDTTAAGPIASQNPAKQATFGVDSTGTEVRILSGSETLAHFRVGKSTPDFSGLFVRLEGSEDVYGVSGINKFLFDRGAQTWRERKIVPFEAESITRLMVAYADTMITFLRQGTDSLNKSAWMMEGNRPDQPSAPAIPEAVRSLIQAAAGLTADAFPAATDTVPSNWEPLAMRLDVEARGGDRATIEFGPKNANSQHYTRLMGRGPQQVFLVGPWRLSRFKKAYADMLQPSGGVSPTQP